jgi:hypothetical protein
VKHPDALVEGGQRQREEGVAKTASQIPAINDTSAVAPDQNSRLIELWAMLLVSLKTAAGGASSPCP